MEEFVPDGVQPGVGLSSQINHNQAGMHFSKDQREK
jgi:hypothetical protein